MLDHRLTRIDLDLPIRDELFLRTIPGAVDYLFEDLRQLAGAEVSVVRRYRNGILISYAGPLRPLAGVRYFDVCSLPLGTEPQQRLAASASGGVLAALRNPGGLQFRIGDVGEDRWGLRDQLVTELGWANSTGAWDLNLETSNGELVAELGPLYLTQRFGELERMPASTTPVIAAVMVRLAKLAAGDVVLDSFCGAGTILVLAGETAPGIDLIGCDVEQKWLAKAELNLATRGVPGRLLNSGAAHLPLANGSVDRVISNLPFGKRIGSHDTNKDLYPAALREIARVMHSQSRAVLLTDDKRLFKESVQRTPLVRVVKEIMLEQKGGLHPTAYVLSKRGPSKRSR